MANIVFYFLGFYSLFIPREVQECIAFPLKVVEAKIQSKIEKIEPLGGFTNQNYLCTTQSGHSFVIKILNAKLTDSAQRKNEKINQMRAWQIDLAPKIELIGEQLAIIDYIAPIKEVLIDEQTLAQCAKVIAQLHYSGLHFEGEFDFIKAVGENVFVRQLQELKIPMKVACHNDLHLSNIIVGSEGMRLIDWEDSAMNDPAWDISYFFVVSFIPENLWPIFLETYCSFMPQKDPLFLDRIKIYRPFVLTKIALFFKSIGNQELENLCMQSAQGIFSDEGYQTFLHRIIVQGRK